MVTDNEAIDSKNHSEDEDVKINGDSDDYWEKRYTVVPQNIPSFLQSHAHMILRTGKYLNVIRESG